MTSSKHVVFLVGLPGSGKTHYLEAHKDIYDGYSIVDDPSRELSRESLTEFIKSRPKLIIADPLLCLKGAQESAKKIFAEYEQTWIFFENNLDTCMNNIAYRNDERKISVYFMQSLSGSYYIPDGSNPLVIHKA